MEQVNAQFPTSEARPRFAFVGEAPGEVETMTGIPLTGPSGKLFDQALRGAGIPRAQCLVTNALDFKLRNNDITTVAGKRADRPAGPFAPWLEASVASGAYLSEQLVATQLTRLREELDRVQPDVIVPMGGLAAWALLAVQGHGAIKKIRGTPHASKLFPRRSIPTFHPAFILRSYHLYPILLADFVKARRLAEGTLPDANFSSWTIEAPADFDLFITRLTPPISVDIETVKHSLIDCIGFADARAGFSVPIFDNKTFEPYWSVDNEVDLRARVCRFLASEVPKVFQNGGGYDLQMLWECWRVPTRGYEHDTRILHKSLFPELPADLASMASLHTVLPSWKPLRGAEEKRGA